MSRRTLALLMLPLLLAACAQAPLAVEGSQGFFWGLWDGAVAPIAFVISWFSDTVGIYAAENSGGWYDFGYLLGGGQPRGETRIVVNPTPP